ncbi:MAG: TetR/AcrR family transcriptional regulator [Pseudonocardiaceae bacterium]
MPELDTAILQAALELFIERGVDGTSIEQVAKRAGVGKVSVYRRWSSKEKMLARAIESTREEIPDLLPEHTADVPVTTLVEQALPAQVDALVAPGFRAMVARLLGCSTSHPSLWETYWEHYVLPRRRAAKGLLGRAQQEGLLDADADLDVLLDMLAGSVLLRLLQSGPWDAAEARRYLTTLYRQVGLLPGA